MLSNLVLGRMGLGWIPDESDPRDWDFSKLMLVQRAETSEVCSLRKYVPQMFSQGATSSCTAHAVAANIGLVETKVGFPYSPVSRLFIYYNARRYAAPKVSDSGSSIRYAVKAMAKLGVCDEKWWPFSALKVNSAPGWDPQRYAWGRRNCEYYRIQDRGAERVLKLKSALLAGYPIVFGTKLAESFRDRTGPLVIDRPKSAETIIGGHALLVIGYIHNSLGLCFEIQNSWGAKWRDHGFAWLTEDYIRWDSSADFTVLKGWDALKNRSTEDA